MTRDPRSLADLLLRTTLALLSVGAVLVALAWLVFSDDLAIGIFAGTLALATVAMVGHELARDER